jgi:predicted nucleotidyltransferase component of viral defense system
MFDSVLTNASRKNLNLLASSPFLHQFYLAGGTGCALHLGHRISEDLDFFSESGFSLIEIRRVLQNIGTLIVDYSDSQTLVGRFNATKVGFFQYPYPLVQGAGIYEGVQIASIEDIACMKVDTISSRGKKRDFVDLYFILKSRNIRLRQLFDFFELKYRATDYNVLHVLKSLVYFDDAEKDPDPHMLVEFSWEDLKSFFGHQVKDFNIP